MLWFVKDKPEEARRVRKRDMLEVITLIAPDKTRHEWAQSTTEAEHVIKNLTLDENALVVDPFLGSRAFGIAAAKLGRYFVGIEIDKETVERAKLNIIAQTMTVVDAASAATVAKPAIDPGTTTTMMPAPPPPPPMPSPRNRL